LDRHGAAVGPDYCGAAVPCVPIIAAQPCVPIIAAINIAANADKAAAGA